jgi:O-antigen/teichoic acid export membrane protein
MASLSDKAGFLIAANFVKYAVGFVVPMLLVRLLTKEDYGTYQQTQLVAMMAGAILLLGLPSSIYFFYQHDKEHARVALVQQTIGMLCITGALAVVALVLAAPLAGEWMSNPSLPVYLPIVAIAAGLSIASEHFVHFMIAQDKYATAVMFETGETMVRVVVLVVPLLAGYGLSGVLWSVVVFSLGRFLLRNALLLRGIGWNMIPQRGTLFVGDQLAYSLPMCLTSMVGLIGGALDRMIIAANFKPAEYAIYTVGAMDIPLDSIFQVAVANVLRASLPSLVRDGHFDEIVRLVREAVRKLSIIMLPSFVFLFGFAQEFISLLFTSSYSESVTVFRIYLWLVPLHMMILSPIPQAFGRTKINFYLVGLVTAVHLVLSFVLLHWIGYLGPAASNIASTYLLALLYFIMAVRLLRTTAWKLFPVVELSRVMGAALIALLVSRQALGAVHNSLLNFLLAAGLFAIVFFVAALPLRVFTKQDRDLARRWAGRLRLTRR